MKGTAILKALALKMEREETSDRETKVLFAATLPLIKALAVEIGIPPSFDFDDDVDKAFLIMAVEQVCPEELTPEDREIVEMLKEVEKQRAEVK
jgi:hypothetical protein